MRSANEKESGVSHSSGWKQSKGSQEREKKREWPYPSRYRRIRSNPTLPKNKEKTTGYEFWWFWWFKRIPFLFNKPKIPINHHPFPLKTINFHSERILEKKSLQMAENEGKLFGILSWTPGNLLLERVLWQNAGNSKDLPGLAWISKQEKPSNLNRSRGNENWKTTCSNGTQEEAKDLFDSFPLCLPPDLSAHSPSPTASWFAPINSFPLILFIITPMLV